MVNKYTVTLQLADRNAFTSFVDSIGPLVERLVVTVQAGESEPASAPKERVPRGSKVNDTILEMLQNGPASVKDLKEALEARNLSAGSLSTGLAALQKSGAIQRVGEGNYGLALQQAA